MMQEKTVVLAGGDAHVGSVGISGTLNTTLYSYAGDIENLNVNTFAGKSTIISGSADFGVSLGAGISTATDPKGGVLTGHTVSLGTGLSLTIGDFSIRKSYSKPFKK